MHVNLIKNLKEIFNNLNATNTNVLEQIYSEDLIFEDPAHKIQGLKNFQLYCQNLYQRVNKCKFQFHNVEYFSGGAILEWTMLLQHPSLNRGNEFSVAGVSIIKFNDKIYSHRDYFDLGAMLYEQLPLFGSMTKFIKRKLGTA